MTSSLPPEGGPPLGPPREQPADPLAEWLSALGPEPAARPAFEANLRARVLELPPSVGHWILRLPGREPLYLPTLPTALSLAVLGMALLALGWWMVDLDASTTPMSETVPLIELVPAATAVVDVDEAPSAGSSSDEPSASEGDVREDAASSPADDDAAVELAEEDGEVPGRLPTATSPATTAPPPTVAILAPPTATDLPPPPPPPPAGDDDDDDDDDPPTATPVPSTPTATARRPRVPEPGPTVTQQPPVLLPTLEPPATPTQTPEQVNP